MPSSSTTNEAIERQSLEVGKWANLFMAGSGVAAAYPPAIGIFLRQTTCDLVIGGFDVPKGSLITLSSFVTQRDPRWFAEPEHFDPERFLPERADEIQNGAYFPFGAGPRVCIGQSFAMTEMALVAASMLQKCDVQTVPGTDDPTLQVTMALRPKERLMFRWKWREV